MATSTAQRAGIWVIAIALTGGTILGFIAMIIGSQTQQKSADIRRDFEAKYQQYSKDTAKQQSDLDKRTKELAKKYAAFVSLKSEAKKFTTPVKKLSTEPIKASSGAAIKDNSTYAAYYIGFTPDGKIFDSSIEKDTLKAPLIVRPNGVIKGWTEGMKGKNIGGIYVLTIPSDKAYGKQGSGDKIKPDTPLKFVVMPIEMMKTYTEPEITDAVRQAYATSQQ